MECRQISEGEDAAGKKGQDDSRGEAVSLGATFSKCELRSGLFPVYRRMLEKQAVQKAKQAQL